MITAWDGRAHAMCEAHPTSKLNKQTNKCAVCMVTANGMQTRMRRVHEAHPTSKVNTVYAVCMITAKGLRAYELVCEWVRRACAYAHGCMHAHSTNE
jgi:hypothetical protein